MVNQSENQFALTPCIGCTDQTLHIFPLHELFQDSELLFRAGGHLILPMFRQNRKIIILPLCILFIIGFRLGKFHQMPHTPTDKVAIALHITVPALICPDHFRETHGNRGLFR